MSDLSDEEIATIERFLEGEDAMIFESSVVRRMLGEIKRRRLTLSAEDRRVLYDLAYSYSRTSIAEREALDRLLEAKP